MNHFPLTGGRALALLWSLASLLSFASLARSQNVVPVQANNAGVLLTPFDFLSTNISGSNGVFIHRAPTGHGIIISQSDTGGGVSFTNLNATSNALVTLLVGYDNASSNYLYSLIVGGGAGEVNYNGNAGTTNTTKFGLVNPKVGATNFLKTVELGYGLLATNQTTNLFFAVDPQVIASQSELLNSSNVLRTFTVSNVNSASNDLFNITVINDGIVLNFGKSYVTNASNSLVQVITLVSNVLDALVRTKQHGTANLTNWSLFDTNVWNSRQGGSMVLSNFLTALGVTNIIAGTNAVLFKSNDVLVINALPPGGVGGTGIATNSGSGTNNSFTTPTFQAGPVTIVSNSYLQWPLFYLRADSTVLPNAGFSGGLNVHGALGVDGAAVFVDTVHLLTDLTVDTSINLLGGTLYAAQVQLVGGQGPEVLLRTDSSANIAAAATSDGIIWDGTTLSAEVTTAIVNVQSNVHRAFTISSATTTSNGVVTLMNANSTITSNGVMAVVNTKQHGSTVLTNLAATGANTNITSANTAFISLLSASNQPIVKTISAGAGITLTNNVTNIVIATTSAHITPTIQTSNFISGVSTTAQHTVNVYYTNAASWAWVQAGIALYMDDAFDQPSMGLYIDQDADGTFEETNNFVSFGAINASALSNPNILMNTTLIDSLKPGARFVFTNLTYDDGGSPVPTAEIRPRSSKLWRTGD